MKKNNITKNDYQLIEAFFDRTLGETDLRYFENRLKEDDTFAEQVELYEYASSKVKELYNPTKQAEETLFINRLNQLKENRKSTNTSQKKIGYIILSIAASIALMILFSLPILNLSIPIGESIAKADYKALQVNTDRIRGTVTRTSSNEITNQPNQQLLQAFKAENYPKILQIASQMKTNDLELESIQLIIGIAYRKEGQIDKAIPYFDKVIVQRDIALWNLVAIYLEQHPIDKTNARKYLNQIIKEDFNSKGDAKQILEGL